MRYVLAMTSHGDPQSEWAEETLASFREHVTPEPVAAVFHHDGPGYVGVPAEWPDHVVTIAGGERRGFCAAVRALWEASVHTADAHHATHVFWLEHDFVFERDVNLAELSVALEYPVQMAQVQLMRDAVNAKERAAGGLFESRRGEYDVQRIESVDLEGPRTILWHRSYFTTNPSLMTVEFMRHRPFGYGGRAPYDIECEGKYGLDLIRDGWGFAVWGSGEPWVRHIGQRTGHGY